MDSTPNTETVSTEPQEGQMYEAPQPFRKSCCSGCLYAFLIGLAIVILLAFVVINAEKRREAYGIGYDLKGFGYYYLLHSNARKDRLPPPFRYPDLAGEEDGQVYLDKFVVEAHINEFKSKRESPKDKTAWFKPGEPYLGHRIPKKPNTNAKPLLSWRILIHGYDCNDRWDIDGWPGQEYMFMSSPFPRFWEPWDSEVNSLLGKGMPCCLNHSNYDDPYTDLVAIVGPDTGFGDGKSMPMKPTDCEPDMILVVESRNSGINWMEPRDFDIRTMPRTINAPDGSGISGHTKYGFHVLFADGEVWRIKYTVPFEELEKFFTQESAKRHDRETVLGPYADEKYERIFNFNSL